MKRNRGQHTLFQYGNNSRIESDVKTYLNSVSDFLSESVAKSTRAVGDAIEDLIREELESILGVWCSEYFSDFTRRALEDVAFNCRRGNYYAVDVKTHRADTKFNMPNLVSVERLSRFYEDDKNIFSILMIKYIVDGLHVEVTDVSFVPIEHIDWSCLTIGALGWGQIQLKNSNNISIIQGNPRADWMLELCEALSVFYPREIEKINSRIVRFQSLAEIWKN